MDATKTASFHVRLSYEELAYLAGLLGVAPAIGVEDNPLAGLPADAVNLALAAGGRGLRARQLVQDTAEGKPGVQHDLLTSIGACCFPERVITLHHWAAGETLPSACYGYLRQATVVLHQRPAPGLHDLQTLASSAALIESMLHFGAVTGAVRVADDALQLPAALLVELRGGASNDAAAAAQATVDAAQRAAAGRFATALAGQPQVSSFTMLRSGAGGQIDRREFTFLRQNGAGWLLTAGASQMVHVRSADVETVRGLLDGALAG